LQAHPTNEIVPRNWFRKEGSILKESKNFEPRKDLSKNQRSGKMEEKTFSISENIFLIWAELGNWNG
jgi:hypothetical protein